MLKGLALQSEAVEPVFGGPVERQQMQGRLEPATEAAQVGAADVVDADAAAVPAAPAGVVVVGAVPAADAVGAAEHGEREDATLATAQGASVVSEPKRERGWVSVAVVVQLVTAGRGPLPAGQA